MIKVIDGRFYLVSVTDTRCELIEEDLRQQLDALSLQKKEIEKEMDTINGYIKEIKNL